MSLSLSLSLSLSQSLSLCLSHTSYCALVVEGSAGAGEGDSAVLIVITDWTSCLGERDRQMGRESHREREKEREGEREGGREGGREKVAHRHHRLAVCKRNQQQPDTGDCAAPQPSPQGGPELESSDVLAESHSPPCSHCPWSLPPPLASQRSSEESFAPDTSKHRDRDRDRDRDKRQRQKETDRDRDRDRETEGGREGGSGR